MTSLQAEVLRTLAYYDIFGYPLTAEEVFYFLPSNSVMAADVRTALDQCVVDGRCHVSSSFFSPDPDVDDLAMRRLEMEKYAAGRWKTAHRMGKVIKLFPFVRACFITGTLAKNISDPSSDIDFFIVTAPRRLWICRMILIAFKKTILLNSKKYFCLNYFVSTDSLEIPDRNLFTATEIAHAKPLINREIFDSFLEANGWIHAYLPNWHPSMMRFPDCDNRPGSITRFIERFIAGSWADGLDDYFMRTMQRVWKHRHPLLSDEKRAALFRVQKHVSKAHGPDYETRILRDYHERCIRYGLSSTPDRENG